MTELIYDALADAPGLRPGGVSALMLVAAMVQAIFLLLAFIGLGSMRSRPWTAAQSTTLGPNSGQFFLSIFAIGILVAPVMTALFALGRDRFSVARWGFASAACLGVLLSYPALAAFRSMIPGSNGDVGGGPPYRVAARGSAFGLLAVFLLWAPMLAGSFLVARRWDELRSALAHGQHLTAVGTLDRVQVNRIEQHAQRSSWVEEHDTFALGDEMFEAAVNAG